RFIGGAYSNLWQTRTLAKPRPRTLDRRGRVTTDTTSMVLAGGGELGRRMRAIDWSTTPLGPVESWPRSLRTCVRIILTSQQPMFVWWGEQLINLYNDAYC